MTRKKSEAQGGKEPHPLTGAVARRSKMFHKFGMDKQVELIPRDQMAYA